MLLKNLGFLHAISRGAEAIMEFEGGLEDTQVLFSFLSYFETMMRNNVAIYRFSQGESEFRYLESGNYHIFDDLGGIYLPSAFWSLLIPHKFSDPQNVIWRSLWTQRLLWDSGHRLAVFSRFFLFLRHSFVGLNGNLRKLNTKKNRSKISKESKN